MKIYEYIKSENKRTAKLFGIKIYEQFSDYETSDRTQIFLSGLLATTKTSENFEYHTEKNVKFFGKSIIKRVEDGNIFKWFIFGLPIKTVYLEEEYKNYYLKNVKDNYDDIYILSANSGEVYLFLTYIFDTFLKKNQSKKPLIVATKKYHIDLIKTIFPEVPFIFKEKLKKNIKSDSFKAGENRFFMIFPHSHFKMIDYKLGHDRTEDVHYFSSILERVKISEQEITMRKVVTLEEDEKIITEKALACGLDLNNFIFIAPEAVSCKKIDDSFWVNLINAYKKLGYDVFINIVSNSNNLTGAEYKTFDLTYSQAFALAKKAKKIVSLRSGLTEYLLQTGTPTDILYTEFANRHSCDDVTAEDVIKGFSVLKLPFIKKENIREINMSKKTYNDILQALCLI